MLRRGWSGQPARSLPLTLVLGLGLGLALGLPAAPAQASEAVKLARMVITGKRLGSTPLLVSRHQAQVQQLPRVLVEGQQLNPKMRLAEQQSAGRGLVRPI